MLLVVLEIMTFALDAAGTGCKCHDRTTLMFAVSSRRCEKSFACVGKRFGEMAALGKAGGTVNERRLIML